jgi:adenylate kinase
MGTKKTLNALMFGAPGAGKGTYSSRLKEKLGIETIATGDIFRQLIKDDSELGRKVKGYVEKGLLVPDDVVVEVLKDRLSRVSKERGFILDGYPRTLEQAKVLEGLATIDVILLLDVPDWLIIERLSSRRICRSCGAVFNIRFLKPNVEGVCDKCGGPLCQRSDDTPDVIKKRLQVYEEQSKPMIEYYKKKKVPFVVAKTRVLDQPPEQVVDKMIAELKQRKFI